MRIPPRQALLRAIGRLWDDQWPLRPEKRHLWRALGEAVCRPELPLRRRIESVEAEPGALGMIAALGRGLTVRERTRLARLADARGKGVVATKARGLDRRTRFELALAADERWRAQAALYAPGLSASQRVRLAIASPALVCGQLALSTRRMTARQRFELALRATANQSGRCASDARFSAAQRLELALRAEPGQRRELAVSECPSPEALQLLMTLDPHTRGWAAWWAPNLSDEARTTLAQGSTPKWRVLVKERHPQLASALED